MAAWAGPCPRRRSRGRAPCGYGAQPCGEAVATSRPRLTNPQGCWTIGWNGPEYGAPIASLLGDIPEPSVPKIRPQRHDLRRHAAPGGKRQQAAPCLELALRAAADIGPALGALGMARPRPACSDGQSVTASSGEVSRCPPASRPGRGIPAGETFVTDRNLRTRYLTPLEYERLQGFPDNFTRIPYGGRPEECPDRPWYSARGFDGGSLRVLGRQAHPRIPHEGAA